MSDLQLAALRREAVRHALQAGPVEVVVVSNPKRRLAFAPAEGPWRWWWYHPDAH